MQPHAEAHVESCAGIWKDPGGDSKDPMVANSSLAEQENSHLKKLKSTAIHMKQTHLLWLIRFMLYRQWRKKSQPYLQRNALKRNAEFARAEDHDIVVAAPASEPHIVADALQLPV